MCVCVYIYIYMYMYASSMGSLAFQWRDEEWGRDTLFPSMVPTVAFLGQKVREASTSPPACHCGCLPLGLRRPSWGPSSLCSATTSSLT